MQAELTIFDALQSANVPADKARAAAESIMQEIDRRYAIHSDQLATRGDLQALRADMTKSIESLRSDLFKALNDQTWKLAGIVFASMAFVVAALKFTF
jgi:hypothetical protein